MFAIFEGDTLTGVKQQGRYVDQEPIIEEYQMGQKQNVSERSGVIVAKVVGLALMLSSPLLQAQEVKDQKATPVEIINDDPVEVTGTIAATISEGVTINDVPDEVTDRLDLVLDNLEMLVEKSGQRPALPTYFETKSIRLDGSIQTNQVTIDLGTRVAARSIIITAQNDDVTLNFCDESAPSCTSGNRSGVLTMGDTNLEFPGVFALNFPVPVPVNRFRVICWNNVEDCELSVTIIGNTIS